MSKGHIENLLGTLSVIVPINITHSADIDGVGCGFLSHIAFNRELHGKSYKFIQNPDGLSFDAKYFTDPIIIPIGNNTTSLIDKINDDEIISLINSECIGEHKTFATKNLYFLIIVSDVSCSYTMLSDLDSKLKEFNPEYIFHWNFDHHRSNINYGKKYVSYPIGDNIRERYILPEMVVICDSYFKDNFFIQLFESSVNNSKKVCGDNKESIYFKDHIIERYFSDSKAERSATFIYFMWLLEMGFFNYLLNGHDYILMDIIVKYVYHISNYDTFEFDKIDPHLPVEDGYPDALTVLFKGWDGNFFAVLSYMLDNVGIGNKYSTYVTTNSSTYDVNDGLIEFGLGVDTQVSIKYKEREDSFLSDTRSVVVLPWSVVKDTMQIKYDVEGIRPYDLVAVFPFNVKDASYTGNQICKRYKVKLSIMMYTNSRTLSLRSNNHDENAPDCSLIVKEFNGGGHKNAAGCKVDIPRFRELLTMCWYNKPGISDSLLRDEYKPSEE